MSDDLPDDLPDDFVEASGSQRCQRCFEVKPQSDFSGIQVKWGLRWRNWCDRCVHDYLSNSHRQLSDEALEGQRQAGDLLCHCPGRQTRLHTAWHQCRRCGRRIDRKYDHER